MANATATMGLLDTGRMSGVEAADAESERLAQLLAAEVGAREFFAEVQRRGLVAAGRRNTEVSDAIRDLAHNMFGVQKF